MATTFVAAATKNDESFTSAGTAWSGFSIDCGVAADRAVVVLIGWLNAGGHTVDAVTVGGESATEVTTVVNGTTDSLSIHAFYFANPGTGSQTVVVDPSTGSLNRAAVACALSFSGVDQTTPTANVTTTENAGGVNNAEMDVTVSSAVDDLVVVFGLTANATTGTCDTGDERADFQRTSNGNITMLVSTQAGAASVATEHTWAIEPDWLAQGFTVQQADGGGGGDEIGGAYYQQYYRSVVTA